MTSRQRRRPRIRQKTNLAVKIGLSRLRRIQLKPLPDTFTKYMTRGVCLHNLGHGLLNERLETREPIPKGRPQVISQVHANHEAGWRRVNAHRVRDLAKPTISVEKFYAKTSNLHSPKIWLGCTSLCHGYQNHPTVVERRSKICCWLCHPSGLYSIGPWIS